MNMEYINLQCTYQCNKCGQIFSTPEPEGPFTYCKFCGHNYMDWLNLEELLPKFKKIDEHCQVQLGLEKQELTEEP